MQTEQLVKKLNSSIKAVRKWALYELKRHENSDAMLHPSRDASHINLNIHSDNSFSPYSPTMAAYMAYKSGIKMACLCDYGTTAGQKEFEKACRKLDISSINGFELTIKSELLGESMVAFYCTPENIKDSGYMELLADFRKTCFKRAKAVCSKINNELKKYKLFINFEKEVLPLSKNNKGGCLTLKHVYMAAGRKIIEKYKKGRTIADFLRTSLCLDIDEGTYNLLCDPNNPFYEYDLIFALRTNFNRVSGDANPPLLSDYFKIAKGRGIIKAYQYDCGNNWIKNQTESDETIEEFKNIVNLAKKEGFDGVCISAKNLTSSLLTKFVDILRENEMLAIFTEKTEYPRNHFECAIPPKAQPYIKTCAYAMLGSCICCKTNPNDSLLSSKSSLKCDNFDEKLRIYSGIGNKSL